MKTVLILLFTLLLPQVSVADTIESAVKRAKSERVRTLLAEGADVNKRYGRNRTLLHVAAERGFVSVAELLVLNGADMNAQDSNGDTPLHVAVTNARQAMVRFLMEFGADYRIKNSNNRSVETHAERTISEQRQSGDPVVSEKISAYITKAIGRLPPPRASGVMTKDGTEKSRWGETDRDDTISMDLARYSGMPPEAIRKAAQYALSDGDWTYLTSEPDREIGSFFHRKKDREYRAEIRFEGNQAKISFLRGFDARGDRLLGRIESRFRRELDRSTGAPAK